MEKRISNQKKRSPFSKIVDYFFPDSLSYEEKRTRISLIIVILTISIFGFIEDIPLVSYYFTREGITEFIYTTTEIISFTGGCLLLLFFVFIFLLLRQKYFQFLIFSINFVLFSVFSLVHYFTTRALGGLGGSPLMLSPFMIGISLFFGNTFNKIFWFSAIILNYIGGFIIDIFYNQVREFFADKNNSLFYPFFYAYFINIIVTILFTVIIVLLQSGIRKNKNLITKIGSYIVSLSFENPDLIKLEKKKKKYCNDNELLFKSIIKNVKEYTAFLPDYLRFGDDEDNESSERSYQSFISGDSMSSSNSNSNNSKDSKSSSTVSQSNIKKNKSKKRNKRDLDRKFNFGLNPKKDAVCLEVKANLIDHKSKVFEEQFILFNDIVCESTYSNKGSLYQLSNQRILVSFDCERICTESSLNAMKTAVVINSVLKKHGINSTIVVLKVTDMMCGTLKAKYNSKFHLFSPTLETFNSDIFSKLWNEKNKTNIFVGKEVFEETKYEFLFKHIYDFKQNSFFRLIKKKNTNDKKEWMYSISSSLVQKHEDITGEETKKTTKICEETKIEQFNSIWEELNEGNYQNCKDKLLSYVSENSDDLDVAFLKDKLENLVKNTPNGDTLK